MTMRRFLCPALVGLLLITGGVLRGASAQTAAPYSESFTGYSDGTTDPGDGSWSRTIGPDATPDDASVQTISGDNAFQVTNADGIVTWTTTTITIDQGNAAAFQLSIDKRGELEDSDYVDVKYSLDGGSFTRIDNWNGLGSTDHTLTGGGWKNTTITAEGLSAQDIQVRVVFSNNAASEDFFLDDVTVFGGTRVQFTSVGASVQEGNSDTSQVDVGISILNPSESNDTSVDVAAVKGSATGGSDYSFPSKTVTFAAGDGSSQTVPLDVYGDTKTEGNETVTLELTNASGGNNASLGAPSRFDLLIQGDDGASPASGDLVISEFMYDPSAVSDTDGEWIEVYNASDQLINLEGLTLNVSGETETISASVPVAPAEYALLCRNGSQTANGNVFCDYDYSGLSLNQGGTSIQLSSGGTTVDQVSYGGTDWPSATGASVVFAGTAADDNNTHAPWIKATEREPAYALGSGDLGSPGARGSDQSLAVRRSLPAVDGWRMVAPPVGGLSVQFLASQGHVQGVTGSYPGADDNLFLKYDGDGGSTGSQYWVAADDLNNSLEQGRGALWYLRAGPSPSFLEATQSSGVLNKNYQLTGLGSHKWHLLGNPFPNPFRIDGLNLAAQNFQTTAQVWDPDTKSYQLVRPSTEPRAVGPLVGFWVERSNATGSTSSLTFSAGGQVTANEVVAKQDGAGSHYVHLQLEGRDAQGTTTTVDEALSLSLTGRARTGWDPHDATKLTPVSGSYAVLAFGSASGTPDSTRRSVASYPLPAEGTRRVPLHLVTGGTPTVETFIITRTGLSLPSGWTAKLRDRHAGTTTNLNTQPRYTFAPAAASEAATASALMGHPKTTASRPPPPTPIPLSKALSGFRGAPGAKVSAAPRFELIVTKEDALPVELASLSARSDASSALLSWRTASETNNSGFFIEHKADTTADAAYQTLGFVEGQGTTQRTHSYRYRTEALDPGTHTFRLRQVDTDGSVRYTDPVTVELAPARPLMLTPPSPNPVRTQATVTLAAQGTAPVTVSLFDALGRRIRTLYDGPVSSDRSQSLTVRTRDLASGVYLLRARSGSHTVTQQMIVVR